MDPDLPATHTEPLERNGGVTLLRLVDPWTETSHGRALGSRLGGNPLLLKGTPPGFQSSYRTRSRYSAT